MLVGILIFLVLSVIAVTLVQVKGLQREILKQHLFYSMLGEEDTSSQLANTALSSCGHAIFVWRDNTWHIQEDFSKPGYQSVVPTMEGAFEGHVIRTESTGVSDTLPTK